MRVKANDEAVFCTMEAHVVYTVAHLATVAEKTFGANSGCLVGEGISSLDLYP